MNFVTFESRGSQEKMTLSKGMNVASLPRSVQGYMTRREIRVDDVAMKDYSRKVIGNIVIFPKPKVR